MQDDQGGIPFLDQALPLEVSRSAPNWIPVSDLCIPLIPFRHDSEWPQIKAKIGDALFLLQHNTKRAFVGEPPLLEHEINILVFNMMMDVAELEPKTESQNLWIIELMCRFIQQQYKPSPYHYYPRIMTKIENFEFEDWSDEARIQQIAFKIRQSMGTHITPNFSYLAGFIAYKSPEMRYVFTIVTCVLIRELVLNEVKSPPYVPISPRQVISIAKTFNMKQRNIDALQFCDFILLLSVYIKLVKYHSGLERVMPVEKITKYFTLDDANTTKLRAWVAKAIKYADTQIHSNNSVTWMFVHELLTYDIQVLINGNFQSSRSFNWTQQLF